MALALHPLEHHVYTMIMRCSTLWMAVWRFIDRPFIEIQCWYHVIDQRHEHGPHGNLLQYFFGYLLPSHRHLWKPIQSKTYVLHVNCFFLQFNENTLTNIQTHRYWGPSGRCINCFSVKLLPQRCFCWPFSVQFNWKTKLFLRIRDWFFRFFFCMKLTDH